MAYDADTLVDRRRLKRRLLIWRGLAIAGLVGLVIVAVGRFSGYQSGDYIARLAVGGIIVDDPDRIAFLRRLAKQPGVKALILRIDSPGGTVVGGETLYKALNEFGAKKPIVAIMGEVGTSAAYMIALAAEKIYAQESTITGSIGVIMQTTQITGLLEKIGVSAESVKSGPLKAVPNPLEPMTPPVRRAIKVLIDDMFDMFVGMVVAGRDLPRAEVEKLADGRVFTGRMAVKNRLIDAIGGEREARDWLRDKHKISKDLKIRNVRVPRRTDSWYDWFEGLAQKAVFSERLTLDGLVSVWHPQLQ